MKTDTCLVSMNYEHRHISINFEHEHRSIDVKNHM